MAVSLVHGGPAPNFVSPVLYQCLVSDAKHVHSSLGDVVDPETQDMLQEIENASSLENLQELIQKHSTVLSIAGCFRPLKSLNDKRELLEDFINWYIVGRTVPSLVRLKEGLKTLGVLQAMEIHKHIFEEAFVWMEQEITTDTINGMFNIKFSPSGSNYRIQEEHIIGYWRDYLQDCEELTCQAKIKDILCFVTGANTVPPLGFNPQPSIEFLHVCSGQVQLSMFPEANTCGNVLRLPLSMSYEEFKTNMDFGILNSPGFGRA
ncbi:hypothetical protein NDU88_002557 [Pleurodeles waltl]|uniref:HECT domain-containing protein n=2 Tax=Pleurodeles waltl TaxID=8319 RepID=A0AAV7T2R8_PLEWA|nr:hypothetical protein NDU88_002557 [Pleurodeles waltl]